MVSLRSLQRMTEEECPVDEDRQGVLVRVDRGRGLSHHDLRRHALRSAEDRWRLQPRYDNAIAIDQSRLTGLNIDQKIFRREIGMAEAAIVHPAENARHPEHHRNTGMPGALLHCR